MRMEHMERSSGRVRRSGVVVKNPIKDVAKVIYSDDELDEVEEEEEWDPGAGRKTTQRGQKRTTVKKRTKRNGQQVGELMGIEVVDDVSYELGSLSLSNDSKRRLRAAAIDLTAVPQALVVIDRRHEGIMESSSLRTGEEVVATSSSDDGDDDDGTADYESAGEQEELTTTLSREASALLAELMQVIQKGGDLNKLRVNHLKAYLRHYGLRISGLKAVLLNRIQQHLEIKDGQGQLMYPRSSFTINCRGDVCLGDIVLFSQNVYDSYDIVRRSSGGPPLGKRWVVGRVVNESYGAEKQQHTFTIEVLWSTGTQPFYVMRPLQIKGRNLYRMHTSRQPWTDEAEREKVLAEKHARGEEARAKRRAATGVRGNSGCKPGSRGQSKTRHQGGPLPPAIPPWQNPIHDERTRTQRDVVRGTTASSSHTGNHPAEEASSVPAPHATSTHHGSMRTQPNALHTRHRADWIPPATHPLPNSMQQGRGPAAAPHYTQQPVYGGGHVAYPIAASSVHYFRDEQGIRHIACSNRGCDKAGAKHCITQSCLSCCLRNGATRGSCPRHQS